VNPDAKVFLEKIEPVRQQLVEYIGFFHKLKDRLVRSEKALASKDIIANEVASLVSDLRSVTPPALPSTSDLASRLEQELKRLQQQIAASFANELHSKCKATGMEFVPLPDGYGVGPFLVLADFSKGAASFHYGKVGLALEIPANPEAIVDQAAALKASLIEQPVDLARFGSELQEAMRVVLARQNKSLKGEIRAELPLVFHEMQVIRQHLRTKKSEKGEYSIPRFVVELKRLIQSDQNTRSASPVRLETAVIENTKNAKKSIFIPKDLNRGFGEGTYFQAVLQTM
jgi:hypothetical protein